MKIAVLYDAGANDWSPEDVQGVMVSVGATSKVLRKAGHEVVGVPVRIDLKWADALHDVDLVFNLCEGIEGISHYEYKVASVVELLGLPYTGCSAWTMTVCQRKPLLNAALEAVGLPIPRWCVPNGRSLPKDFPLPAIVKPADEDASVGIDQLAVVTTLQALRERIAYAKAEYGSVFVQQYIQGREFAVGFVGDQMLPISEIDFRGLPEGTWPIVSFAAKWQTGSVEDVGTRPVCPAKIDQELAKQVQDVAAAAWKAVEGRGYGRVDLRVDETSRPWVLEVNPNPDLSTDAGMARMARAFGWSYTELVHEVVRAAFEAAARRAAAKRPRRRRPRTPAAEAPALA